MRTREVYIHAIDLATGITFADLPPEFVTALLDEVTVSRSAKGGGPALVIAATDTGGRWNIAGSGAPVPVTAPLRDLAAPRPLRRPGPPALALKPSQRGREAPPSRYPPSTRTGSHPTNHTRITPPADPALGPERVDFGSRSAPNDPRSWSKAIPQRPYSPRSRPGRYAMRRGGPHAWPMMRYQDERLAGTAAETK